MLHFSVLLVLVGEKTYSDGTHYARYLKNKLGKGGYSLQVITLSSGVTFYIYYHASYRQITLVQEMSSSGVTLISLIVYYLRTKAEAPVFFQEHIIQGR